MAFADIPVRINNIDNPVTAEWFNTIRTELVNAFGSGGYIKEQSEQTLTTGDEITLDAIAFKPMVPVKSDGGEVTVSTTPFGVSHGFTGGKEIILVGTDDTDYIVLQGADISGGLLIENDLKVEKGVVVLFIYSEVLDRFVVQSGVGSGVIGKYEDIGVGNGVQTQFSTTFLPTESDAVSVIRNGAIVPSSQYSIVDEVITFNTPPASAQNIAVYYTTEGTPSTPPTGSGTFKPEYFTINNTQLTNKEINLSNTPSNPLDVVLDVVGGSPQEYGVDYQVTGNVLSWNGLGLDGQVALGSKLRVIYFY